MIRRSVSCSWCHHMNGLDNPAQVHCTECGHRADLPRAECNCPRCKPTGEERERQRAQRAADMAELLRRVEAGEDIFGGV